MLALKFPFCKMVFAAYRHRKIDGKWIFDIIDSKFSVNKFRSRLAVAEANFFGKIDNEKK